MGEAPTLLGRATELDRIDGLLDDATRRGGSLLLVGDPGVGKSELLSAAAERAREREMLVLRTSGVSAETHLPFAGLHQLLQPVLPDAEGLPDFQRNALMAAFGHIDAEVGDHLVVALATLNLVRARTAEAPVLLVVEDVHWLDRLSVDVLAFVARRIETDSIVILASSREAPGNAIDEAVLDLLTLEGLDAESASALVDHHTPDLDPLLRERLLAEADGNPLALVELSIAWRLLPPGTLISTQMPMTTRLERTFASRFDTLPLRTQVLVRVAALNDGELLAETLAAAGALTGDTITDEAIMPAVEERLVEVDVRGVRFRHPLVRSAIRGAATLSQRRAAHVALANVIADDDRAVWHRAAAALEPDEAIAASLEESAMRARRQGAIFVSVTALERAASLTPDPAVRGRRLVRAAEFAVELGRQEVVERLLNEAEPLDLDPVDRARAAWRRRVLDGGVWRDIAQVRALVEITDDLSAAGDTDLALDALTYVTLTGWWTNFDNDRRELIVDAAERIPVALDEPRLLSILGMTAPAERGAVVLDRLEHIPPSSLDPVSLVKVGAAAHMLGHHEMAAEFLGPALYGLRSQGLLNGLSSVLSTMGTVLWFLGDWNTAASMAAEAQRIGEQIDRAANAAVGMVVEGLLAAGRGDVESAEAIAARIEQQFRPLGAVPLLQLAAFVRGLAALADGRSELAYDLLYPLVGPGQSSSMICLNQLAIPSYFDAAAQTGEVDDARKVLDVIQQLTMKSGSPTMEATVRYPRPLLATDGDAEELFAAALASDLDRWPFMHAKTLLAQGSWLRRQRRVNESRAPLRMARDLFDALGALPWGERARQELRATGEVSSERRGDATEKLTPQELEIATLAAAGLTNREIGQQLYLSHRTVGSHLYHLFPKLGISSRSELADVLNDAPD